MWRGTISSVLRTLRTFLPGGRMNASETARPHPGLVHIIFFLQPVLATSYLHLLLHALPYCFVVDTFRITVKGTLLTPDE